MIKRDLEQTPNTKPHLQGTIYKFGFADERLTRNLEEASRYLKSGICRVERLLEGLEFRCQGFGLSHDWRRTFCAGTALRRRHLHLEDNNKELRIGRPTERLDELLSGGRLLMPIYEYPVEYTLGAPGLPFNVPRANTSDGRSASMRRCASCLRGAGYRTLDLRKGFDFVNSR